MDYIEKLKKVKEFFNAIEITEDNPKIYFKETSAVYDPAVRTVIESFLGNESIENLLTNPNAFLDNMISNYNFLPNWFQSQNKKKDDNDIRITFNKYKHPYIGETICDEYDHAIDKILNLFNECGYTIDNINFPTVVLSFEDFKKDDESNIFELLGTYNHQNCSITLYQRLIYYTAGQLKIPTYALSEVVYLHELGHWITHCLPKNGKTNEKDHIWQTDIFNSASKEVKESWAQLIALLGTYFLAEDKKDKHYYEAFLLLNENQSDDYLKYKDILAMTPLNDELLNIPNSKNSGQNYLLNLKKSNLEAFNEKINNSLKNLKPIVSSFKKIIATLSKLRNLESTCTSKNCNPDNCDLDNCDFACFPKWKKMLSA